VSVGRWWKCTYDQIHDDSRTEAQSAKTFEKGFLGFCLKPSAQAKGFVKIKIRVRNKKDENKNYSIVYRCSSDAVHNRQRRQLY
jgi:hypothetical protein